jgi:hypothetical protein
MDEGAREVDLGVARASAAGRALPIVGNGHGDGYGNGNGRH